MTAGTYQPDTDVMVPCPETGVQTRVRMEWDAEGDPVVTGCSRFWGHLHCRASCWPDAVKTLDQVRNPPRYCGHPNLCAPRPRELGAN